MAFLRYALIVLCMIFVVSGLATVLAAAAQIRLGMAGIGAIAVFMAALIEGQLRFKRREALPDTRQKLGFAAMATAINLVLLGPLLVLKSLGDPAFEAMLRGFDMVLWSAILAAVVVITFPASYVFFGAGARSQQKAAARQKARQGGAK